jgi:probable addiction module antidote protein
MSEADFDRSRYRDNPEAIASYLDELFAENDFPQILLGINRVMRAQNVQAIAREAGLRRDRLYKTFGGEIDPQLGRVMALFEGFGVRLAVVPLTTPKDPSPRPKLGRPPKTVTELKKRARRPERSASSR